MPLQEPHTSNRATPLQDLREKAAHTWRWSKLPTRKRGTLLATGVIVILIAALVFWGVWTYLNSQGKVSDHPHVSMITHSTPFGGAILDGVFHPTAGDLHSIRWQI